MRVLLHIGYPKTATTYLQNVVFPALDKEQVNYISDRFLIRNKVHDICYQYSSSIDVNQYRELLKLDSKKLNVISYEGFVGNWRNGAMNQAEVFASLKNIFGSPRVLLVTRNQTSMLLSLYKQFVQEGGTYSFEKFLTTNNRNIYFNWDFLKYDQVISRLERTFGKESIFVIPYELFRSDEEAFIRLLSRALEINGSIYLKKEFPNRSLHNYLLNFLKATNFLVKGSIHPNFLIHPKILSSMRIRLFLQRQMNDFAYRLFPGVDEKFKKVHKGMIARFTEYYEDSNLELNRYLEERHHLTLKNLGYKGIC